MYNISVRTQVPIVPLCVDGQCDRVRVSPVHTSVVTTRTAADGADSAREVQQAQARGHGNTVSEARPQVSV